MPAAPSTINASRRGSRANSIRSLDTSVSRGRTAVASQRRRLGTSRKVPTAPSATPAIRYSMVGLGTKCDRSADAPAAVLKMISSATCTITCTDCCNATAAVARSVLSPPLTRNRVESANPPTPAGVVVAANVLATCMIDRFRKLTAPLAQAHNAPAAPT
ncbi:hypothetical protein C1Y40_03373 [Mycobacterium talmoniae]|uniref:Uncharacterized protein n=1 Tax=Mycobacterium talmoniae TaxID=1858794 RepID=A0A2S8BIE8_9MYCO|nr:hypothetical protein C1Y40_03373 [Mycobacterium talmoniae]